MVFTLLSSDPINIDIVPTCPTTPASMYLRMMYMKIPMTIAAATGSPKSTNIVKNKSMLYLVIEHGQVVVQQERLIVD